jgi:hypothetical protein
MANSLYNGSCRMSNIRFSDRFPTGTGSLPYQQWHNQCKGETYWRREAKDRRDLLQELL